VKYFKFQRSYNQKHSVDRKLVMAVIYRKLVSMGFSDLRRKRYRNLHQVLQNMPLLLHKFRQVVKYHLSGFIFHELGFCNSFIYKKCRKWSETRVSKETSTKASAFTDKQTWLKHLSQLSGICPHCKLQRSVDTPEFTLKEFSWVPKNSSYVKAPASWVNVSWISSAFLV